MDFLKSTEGGSFGSAGGRIPEGGGGVRPPPPLNLPLLAILLLSEADLGFSRGGFSKSLSTFFYFDLIDFPSS